MKQIFLDYASTTPVSPLVRAAMEPYFTDQFYNPSALYLAAKKVKHDLEGARAEVASLLGVRASEIVFTAGTTEANNVVLRGVMALHEGAHLVVSAIEHDSVIHSAREFNHDILPVSEQGIVNVDALKGLIKDTTVLVSVMLANNEIGTVQPLHELATVIAVVRKERAKQGNSTPLYLHTDAAQAYAYMPVLPHSIGADFVVISGSKLHGPKQVAALYIKTGARLKPYITGGGQEWGLRAGTENVPSSIGLAAAMKETALLRTGEVKRMAELQELFLEELKAHVPQALFNGSLKRRLPNNVHVTIKDCDNETLIMQLDEVGIMAATGSACSASSNVSSHVLKAIGLSDKDARSSLRFTMGRETTAQDIKTTVQTLATLLK